MNWKTLTVLVLLAAGLGGFFAYDTYWLSPAREKTEAVKGRLWDVEAKDVEAVTIKRKTDTIKVKHAADGGWELLEPVKARGDRSAIDGIVTTLVTARVDREIDPKPATLAEFGLEPPDAEITVEVKGRKDPLVLLIGGKNPTGVWVYGKEGSKPVVLALSEIVFRDMSRPVAELRDKTVLAFDRKTVSGFDVEVGGDRFSVEAQDAGKWKIVKPGPYPGDTELVAEFLDKLEGAKAKEFIAEPGTSLAKYGLDRPVTVTIWVGKDKERSSKALAFGRLDPEKKGVYLMRPGEPEVMLAAEELWTAIPKTVATLRDKVVVAYAYDKLTRVEVESPKGPLTLERDGSAWKLTAPEALKADPAAVNNLLWRVRDLRSVGFLAEEPAAIARYLPKPEVTVRLWEEGAKEPKTLLLAPSKETRGGQPAAVAAVAGQGPVMLVDGTVLQDLARTGDDLRDRLMLGFEVVDVKRARLTAAGKMVLVERKGDSDWKVVEPKAGATKENKVTDLLLTMKALRWKAIVSQKGDDAAKFGLDRPEVELTLLKADGTEIGGLLLGREEGGVTYVKLKASPTIYAVDSRLVADLRKGPTDIPS